MFGFNKRYNLEDALIKISDLKIKVATLENEMQLLKTNMNSLRGLINRKINPEKLQEETETETNKKDEIFLSPNGLPIKSR